MFVFCYNLLTGSFELVQETSIEDSRLILDHVAREFINKEQGEKAANSPFRDDTPDEKIDEDGYFLRHDINVPDRINVFQRKTVLLRGMVWNSTVSNVTQVMYFGLVATPIPKPPQAPVIPQAKAPTVIEMKTPKMFTQIDLKYLDGLNERLAKKRRGEAILTPVPQRILDEAPAEDEELLNPKDRLRRKIEMRNRHPSMHPKAKNFFTPLNVE